MDVQEVRKLDAYLRRLFGNARIRVVPTKADAADVFVGRSASARSFSTKMKRMTSVPIISR